MNKFLGLFLCLVVFNSSFARNRTEINSILINNISICRNLSTLKNIYENYLTTYNNFVRINDPEFNEYLDGLQEDIRSTQEQIDQLNRIELAIVRLYVGQDIVFNPEDLEVEDGRISIGPVFESEEGQFKLRENTSVLVNFYGGHICGNDRRITEEQLRRNIKSYLSRLFGVRL